MHHNILITGGAGFIGSRLITALLKLEPACRIWVLDNINSQRYDFKSKIFIFSGGVEFVQGNATLFFSILSSTIPPVWFGAQFSNDRS